MSLRVRLIACTLLILLVSLALGAGLAVWHARQSVRTELTAALAGGARTLRNGADDLPNAADRATEITRLVSIFDGSRHVRALLIGPDGATRAASRPLTPDVAVPGWFLWAVDPRLAPVSVRLRGSDPASAITLVTIADNEASEVWGQYGDSGATLAAYCLLTTVLILLVVGRALRPVAALSDAFDRIGAGDYDVRLPRSGAPELIRLADGFNRMALGLATMQRQNQRLHEQLLTLQDEERAELARDLHDEIGPYLFSVNISAATIGQMLAGERVADIPGQVRDIRESVGHMQKHVGALLRRLRPVRALEFGLAQAITDLVAFWRARHEAITFTITMTGDMEDVEEQAREVIYRIAQESLSNAVRHGRPSRVDVAVTVEDEAVVARVADDGNPGPESPAGFGLSGMRERVVALGGDFTAGPDRQNGGWRVRARLPRRPDMALACDDARAAA